MTKRSKVVAKVLQFGCNEKEYSETCIRQPLLGPLKSGRFR